MATSKGIAATKLQASSSDIPVATFATCGLSTSINKADCAGSANPTMSCWTIIVSARIPAKAGAHSIAIMM